MRIFWHEMRKIWRLPIIAAIIIVSAMIFYLLCDYYLPVSHISKTTKALIQVMTELKDEYGGTLEYEEWLDAHKYIDKYCADLDNSIIGNPIYEEAGIFNGKQLWDFMREEDLRTIEFREKHGDFEEWTQEIWDEYYYYHDNFWSPFLNEYEQDSHSASWKLQELDSVFTEMRKFYTDDTAMEVFLSIPFKDEHGVFLSEQAEKDAEYLYNVYGDAYTNIFPGDVLAYTRDYFIQVAVIIVMSLAILLLPVLTRDKRSNMVGMQWSCKHGRKIASSQFMAAAVSGFALTVIQLAVFLTVYFVSNGDFALFMNQSVFSVTWFCYPWINLTFTQYTAVFVSLILIAAVGASALLFFLSMFGRDYISLLLKALPLTTALCFLSNRALNYPLCYNNNFYNYLPIKGIEFIVCGIVLIMGLILCAAEIKRLKRKDLLI